MPTWAVSKPAMCVYSLAAAAGWLALAVIERSLPWAWLSGAMTAIGVAVLRQALVERGDEGG